MEPERQVLTAEDAGAVAGRRAQYQGHPTWLSSGASPEAGIMMLTVTGEAGQGEAEEVRPVLAGKLRQPGLRPGAVSRPRLQDRLESAGQPALTLVSAPAGFGKTTLVGQWLSGTEAASPAVAWVSLEAGDADPVTFWRYVQAAVVRATGIEGADAAGASTVVAGVGDCPDRRPAELIGRPVPGPRAGPRRLPPGGVRRGRRIGDVPAGAPAAEECAC